MKKNLSIFAGTRLLISGLLTAGAVLALAACAPVTGPEPSGPSAGKGLVNIQLGVDEPAAPASSAARTLVPGSVDPSAFSSYKLVFTPSGGGTAATLEDQTSLSGISLDVGTYSLSLSAYTVSGESKLEAAAGSAAGIAVTDSTTTPVTVPLVFKPGAGDGTLSFTVTRPSGFELSGAQFSLTPLHIGGITYGTDWLNILYTGEKKTSHSSTETIESGYYVAVVTLSTAEREAAKSDIVHIGKGQATTLNWTFSETDFLTTVTDLWILGVNGQWDDYSAGNKLDLESDGTFTWEGEMDPGSFRFSLDNTTTWGGDKLRPGRFQPETNDTSVTFDTAVPMTYVARNTEPVTAWNLGGTGYYTFAVDAYAKTVTVTKPVTVTGVSVKDSGGTVISAISLARGTVDYQFTAEVQGTNVTGTGVTWTISGAHDAGTTIGTTDGKLTIDGAETNTSITVTATSAADTSKSASVTVTVTQSVLPSPQSVSLSGQGLASWTAPEDETNVVKYSVQLYKNGTAEGLAREVTKGGTYSVDLLSAMRGGGAGSYTVKVKAVGDGVTYADSPEVESGAQTVSQKTAVQYTWWFETGKARWVNVDGDSDYTVQLYKGGTAVGGPAAVSRSAETDPGNPAETVTTHDFNSGITAAGPGSYTFGVVTKGDAYLALDAEETRDNTKAYTYDVKLSAPAGLSWTGTAAQWTAVSNATGYSVQLYKDGSASGAAVPVTTGTSYAGFSVSAAGLYTFTVQALGTGTAGSGAYLDSDEADSADTAGGAGELRAGGAAGITLTASENWAGTLEVSGGSTNIAKSTGSLLISVTGGSFTSFVWIVDGITLADTTASITLSGSDYSLGGHSVTVYALDSGGVPWSPSAPLSFTVTAN